MPRAAGAAVRARTRGTAALLLSLVCLLSTPKVAAQQPRQAPESWTVRSELRLGDDEPGEAYQFTRLWAAAVSPDRLVHVVQLGEPAVRVYDGRGQHVRTIGRGGEGPGEFRAPMALGFLGDTLWTYDRSLRRISYFAPGGAFIRAEAPLPMPTPRSPNDPVVFASIETLLRDGTAIGSGGSTALAAATGAVRSRPWVRMSRAGAILGTIVSVRISRPLALRRGEGERQSTTYGAQPLSDEPLVTATGSGRLYVVERDAASSSGGARFTVLALNVNGDTLWTRQVPYAPKRLTSRMVDSVVNARVESFSRGGLPYTASEVRAAMFVPDFWPPVTRALAGEDGTLWLRREDAGATVDYVVLSRDGVILATLSVPRAVNLLWVSGDDVWAAETDADDVPLLVKYRIVKPSRGR